MSRVRQGSGDARTQPSHYSFWLIVVGRLGRGAVTSICILCVDAIQGILSLWNLTQSFSLLEHELAEGGDRFFYHFCSRDLLSLISLMLLWGSSFSYCLEPLLGCIDTPSNSKTSVSSACSSARPFVPLNRPHNLRHRAVNDIDVIDRKIPLLRKTWGSAGIDTVMMPRFSSTTLMNVS